MLREFKRGLRHFGTRGTVERQRAAKEVKERKKNVRDGVRTSEADKESEREGEREEPKEIDTIAIIKAEDEVTAGDMVLL